MATTETLLKLLCPFGNLDFQVSTLPTHALFSWDDICSSSVAAALSLAHSIRGSTNFSYPSAFAFSSEVTCPIQQLQLIWTHFTNVLIGIFTFLPYRILL